VTPREKAKRILAIEKEAARKIRAAVLKAARSALRSGVFPIRGLEAELEEIIRDYSERPARELYEDSFTRKNADSEIDERKFREMGGQLAKKVRSGGVEKKDMALLFMGSISLAEAYCKWAKNLSQADLESLPKSTPAADLMSAGKAVARQGDFPHRYDLSEKVWKSARESQDKIMAVIDGGRALGRDGVEIARDLEELCQHSDGGRRVKGRWGRLAPDKKLEERTDRIMQDRGWDSWDIEKMKEARKTAVKELHKEGWSLSDNPNAEAYYKRLGTAGADYRALRLERTETRFALREEAVKDAAEVGMAVKWTLTDSHDSGCSCAGNKDGTLYKGDNYSKGVVNGRQVGTEDGVFLPEDLPEIPHPNCMCLLQPVKTPEALVKSATLKTLADKIRVLI
jgi:hypothetical protein